MIFDQIFDGKNKFKHALILVKYDLRFNSTKTVRIFMLIISFRNLVGLDMFLNRISISYDLVSQTKDVGL